ncbi:ATP-binding protein [Polaribacter sp. L3A8]|uniref:ATP-binding protein n=1 Tax=Polaribacter sp. L3A8 TaxID=2686361 RepID=UPI00131EA072|nr:ATP-binding protein [Polaribacter sp. L3A8]
MKSIFFYFFLCLSLLTKAQTNIDTVTIKKKLTKLQLETAIVSIDTTKNRIYKLLHQLNRIKSSFSNQEKETKTGKAIKKIYTNTVISLIENIFLPEAKVDSIKYYHTLLEKNNSDYYTLARTIKHVGYLSNQKNDIANAVKNFNKSIDYFDKANAKIDELETIIMLASTYIAYDLPTYTEETIAIFEARFNSYKKELIPKDYRLLEISFKTMKASWISAGGDCKKALSIIKSINLDGVNNLNTLADYYKESMLIHLDCGNYDEAIACLKKAYDEKYNNFKEFEQFKNGHYLTIYLQKNDLEKAAYYVDLLKKDSTINKNTDISINKSYSKFYKATGNYKLALQYKEKHHHILDSINSLKSKITNDLTIYKLKLDNEVVKLNAQNKSQEIINKRTKEYLIYVFIAIIYILLFTFYRISHTRNKKRYILNLELEKNKEIVALKNLYIQNLSHEIRTPITIIIGYLSLIRQNIFDNAKILDYTNKTLKSSEQLTTSLNDFLTLLKLENKKIISNTESKNLGAFLKKIVYSFEGNVTLKRINLYYKTNIKATNKNLTYDYNSLTKIIHNLITNAIKYTHTGETIYVETLVNKNELLITIKDTGIGISEEEIPHIFSRFFQSKEHINSGGFGIGLSLVSELIKNLNGKIDVKSKKNKGTTFTVTLTLDKNNDLQVTENTSDYILINEKEDTEKEKDSKKRNLPKILIVDDNTDILIYLKELLSTEFNCFTCYNGKDGLTLAKAYQFNLVLSDLYMPIMQGFKFKEELNKLDKYKETPFILMSASPPEETEALKLTLGIDDFIVKPFKAKEIQSRIYNLLENKIYRDKLQNINYNDIEMTSYNSEFVNKVRSIILENLNNSEFSVNDLATACNYSTKQLGRILQAKTGLSTVKIILEIRLLKAYELILKNEYQTIKEVTFAIGLNSTDYFNKAFTKRFGIKPSELIK